MAFADPASSTLGGCRVAGGPPGLAMLVTDLRVPLDDPTSALAALARADGPLRFRDAAGDPDEGNRRIAAVLGSTGFVGTPLVTQGRSVGVLVVGDRRSGRDLAPADGPLLFTVGSLFAGAIESARLYAELEAQNRALEATRRRANRRPRRRDDRGGARRGRPPRTRTRRRAGSWPTSRTSCGRR